MEPTTSRCDCEHLNCELGSLRFKPTHKAGGCMNRAAVRIESFGMKVNLCTQCELRWRETS